MSIFSEVLDDYGQDEFLSISSFLPQTHEKRGLWEEFLGLYTCLYVSSLTSY